MGELTLSIQTGRRRRSASESVNLAYLACQRGARDLAAIIFYIKTQYQKLRLVCRMSSSSSGLFGQRRVKQISYASLPRAPETPTSPGTSMPAHFGSLDVVQAPDQDNAGYVCIDGSKQRFRKPSLAASYRPMSATLHVSPPAPEPRESLSLWKSPGSRPTPHVRQASPKIALRAPQSRPQSAQSMPGDINRMTRCVIPGVHGVGKRPGSARPRVSTVCDPIEVPTSRPSTPSITVPRPHPPRPMSARPSASRPVTPPRTPLPDASITVSRPGSRSSLPPGLARLHSPAGIPDTIDYLQPGLTRRGTNMFATPSNQMLYRLVPTRHLSPTRRMANLPVRRQPIAAKPFQFATAVRAKTRAQKPTW